MNYDLTVDIYKAMKAGDEHLLLQVLHAAIRYSSIRAEWRFKTIEERLETDKQRTSAHNAFIDAINILSRSMAKAGQSNDWKRLLPDDRKVIGDFACFLMAHLGILAR